MTMICVSLIDKTVSSLTASAKECKALGADLIEIRLDYIKEPVSIKTLKRLSQLHKADTPKTILTIRPTWEGGKFEGFEERRIDMLEDGIKLGFDYVDIELNMDELKRKQLIEKAKKNGVKTIISYHNFEKTPVWKEIFNLIKECANNGGDIAKLVFNNNSYSDALSILKACSAAHNLNYKFSVMGMGPLGHITRILAPALGCEMVYASLGVDKNVVEGQVDIKTLLEMWNILNFGKIKKGLEKSANINW